MKALYFAETPLFFSKHFDWSICNKYNWYYRALHIFRHNECVAIKWHGKISHYWNSRVKRMIKTFQIKTNHSWENSKIVISHWVAWIGSMPNFQERVQISIRIKYCFLARKRKGAPMMIERGHAVIWVKVPLYIQRLLTWSCYELGSWVIVTNESPFKLESQEEYGKSTVTDWIH